MFDLTIANISPQNAKSVAKIKWTLYALINQENWPDFLNWCWWHWRPNLCQGKPFILQKHWKTHI